MCLLLSPSVQHYTLSHSGRVGGATFRLVVSEGMARLATGCGGLAYGCDWNEFIVVRSVRGFWRLGGFGMAGTGSSFSLTAGGGDSCGCSFSESVVLKSGDTGVKSSMERFENGFHEGEHEGEESKNPTNSCIDIFVFSSEGWGINLFKQMLVVIVRGDVGFLGRG